MRNEQHKKKFNNFYNQIHKKKKKLNKNVSVKKN